MPTLLNPTSISITPIVDPAGTTGIAAGHKFANSGRQWLRIANSATNTNAVLALVPGGTVSGGTFILAVTLQIGATAPVVYTTATVAYNAPAATIATAVLAATSPLGNAMSADFPSGTVTGGGSAPSAGTATLTFAGTFAAYAIAAPVVNAAAVTGGGTIDGQVQTAGKGNGICYIAGTPVAVGAPANQYFVIPANATYWVGEFNPALVNQSGADANNAYLFYDTPGNYTTTVFQLA